MVGFATCLLLQCWCYDKSDAKSSGASTGVYEALELRDKDTTRPVIKPEEMQAFEALPYIRVYLNMGYPQKVDGSPFSLLKWIHLRDPFAIFRHSHQFANWVSLRHIQLVPFNNEKDRSTNKDELIWLWMVMGQNPLLPYFGEQINLH